MGDLVLVRPNGTHFTMPHDMQMEYFSAIFSTIQLQEWDRNDILMFDNILYGHFRMPGQQPRKLHAICGDEIDTRTLRMDDAPSCVHEGATLHARSSTEAVLERIGMGGNMYLLWTINLFPDIIFQIAGY